MFNWATMEKFPYATNYHAPLTYRKFVIYLKSFVKCGHGGYRGIANLNCRKVRVCTWNVFMQGTCKDIRGSEVTWCSARESIRHYTLPNRGRPHPYSKVKEIANCFFYPLISLLDKTIRFFTLLYTIYHRYLHTHKLLRK